LKRKKILIYFALIAAFTIALTILPIQLLSAAPTIVDLTGGVYQAFCQSNEHYIEFNVQDGTQYRYRLNVDDYMPPGWSADSQFFAIEFQNAAGNIRYRPLEAPIRDNVTFINYKLWWNREKRVAIEEPSYLGPVGGLDLVWVRFWYTGSYSICHEPAWVRTMPMMCQHVWINEDGHFQFVFLYPFADNNWVRIYTMNPDGTAGDMVFEADMPWDNPNLIVDLPDGTYIVRTYHDQPDPIQEFVIGKPAPEEEM
jgi:hypothetical protein